VIELILIELIVVSQYSPERFGVKFHIVLTVMFIEIHCVKSMLSSSCAL